MGAHAALERVGLELSIASAGVCRRGCTQPWSGQLWDVDCIGISGGLRSPGAGSLEVVDGGGIGGGAGSPGVGSIHVYNIVLECFCNN